jgi:hypothetical protein
MSEPLHPAFCQWLQRNRARMSREAFEAGNAVACWLHLVDSGYDVRERIAPAFKEFIGLLPGEQTAPFISTLATEQGARCPDALP